VTAQQVAGSFLHGTHIQLQVLGVLGLAPRALTPPVIHPPHLVGLCRRCRATTWQFRGEHHDASIQDSATAHKQDAVSAQPYSSWHELYALLADMHNVLLLLSLLLLTTHTCMGCGTPQLSL
jgi:hypothetical protein